MNISHQDPLVIDVKLSQRAFTRRQYFLLKIRSCCISLLMRGGKVRPGGAVLEKLLTFGGGEQPCDQSLKGRTLSLSVNGVFVMYSKCS